MFRAAVILAVARAALPAEETATLSASLVLHFDPVSDLADDLSRGGRSMNEMRENGTKVAQSLAEALGMALGHREVLVTWLHVFEAQGAQYSADIKKRLEQARLEVDFLLFDADPEALKATNALADNKYIAGYLDHLFSYRHPGLKLRSLEVTTSDWLVQEEEQHERKEWVGPIFAGAILLFILPLLYVTLYRPRGGGFKGSALPKIALPAGLPAPVQRRPAPQAVRLAGQAEDDDTMRDDIITRSGARY